VEGGALIIREQCAFGPLATLRVAVGSEGPHEPPVAVGGEAALDGTLQIELVGSTPPVHGQPVFILHAARVEESFDEVIVYVSPCHEAQVEYTATDVLVTFVESACPADVAPAFAGDETINADDIFEVMLTWGPCQSTLACSADTDCSGAVDAHDLVAVILAWGPCP
jgi:hypothetical protein